MIEEKPKLKTFRDLRSLTSTSSSSSASSPSRTSTTSTPSSTSISNKIIKSEKSSSTSTKKNSNKKIENEGLIGNPKKKVAKSKRVLFPTSPEKDYQKVPNSVVRNALPLGIFRGKSKQVYDYLWSISRGAINPKREVTATRSQIKENSGLGSMVTVDAAINHLQNTGLIERTSSVGSSRGNSYEVFTLEEIEFGCTSISSASRITRLSHKVDELVHPESGISSITQTTEDNNTYSPPKTSLKTINPDDEQTATFADFNKRISEASERITGKKINPKESKKWEEVADLLILELELAAARTGTISSVPAFLKEVLRRKLETKPAATSVRPGKVSKQMQVGKSDLTTAEPENWEREALSKEEREKTLQVMRERKAEGHLELVKSMEQTYTTEDWKWLMESLEGR